MENEINALIAQLESARQQLNQTLAKIPPQAEIYPSWKVKHLLDHITGWDELLAATFRTHALGEAPSKVVHGIDRYNAQSVEQRKAYTDEQSWQAYQAARAAVIQSLKDMPAERLAMKFTAPWGGVCNVAVVVKIFSSHEREHASQIEEIITRSS